MAVVVALLTLAAAAVAAEEVVKFSMAMVVLQCAPLYRSLGAVALAVELLDSFAALRRWLDALLLRCARPVAPAPAEPGAKRERLQHLIVLHAGQRALCGAPPPSIIELVRAWHGEPAVFSQRLPLVREHRNEVRALHSCQPHSIVIL